MRAPAHNADAPRFVASGDDYFAATLSGIQAATTSIDLETYIVTDSPIGRAVRDALTSASRRGVKVRVLLDFLGSLTLRDDFWDPLRQAGGRFTWFNPYRLRPIRDHRKIVICDGHTAWIGGYNIAPEYLGDGVTTGWRDCAVRVGGPAVAELTRAFERMLAISERGQRQFDMLRRNREPAPVDLGTLGTLLLGGPGRTQNAILRSLFRDLSSAKDVRLLVPYFLPGIRLRRAIQRVVRRGGVVQLILPGKSDVPMSRLAARDLYQRMLNNQVRIFEFQPQVLHGKLFIIDDCAYIGSCNLDTRSLRINYEVMLRITSPQFVQDARGFLDETLRYCRAIDPRLWKTERGLMEKLRERWSHFLLSKVDPYVTRWLEKR